MRGPRDEPTGTPAPAPEQRRLAATWVAQRLAQFDDDDAPSVGDRTIAALPIQEVRARLADPEAIASLQARLHALRAQAGCSHSEQGDDSSGARSPRDGAPPPEPDAA
ncbi:MAG: hypothetical protein AAGG50_10815 [Bacteroidota bacterium]